MDGNKALISGVLFPVLKQPMTGLKNTRLLRNDDIRIETRNGEVTLFGFVDVLAEKWAAGEIAAQVPGLFRWIKLNIKGDAFSASSFLCRNNPLKREYTINVSFRRFYSKGG